MMILPRAKRSPRKTNVIELLQQLMKTMMYYLTAHQWLIRKFIHQVRSHSLSTTMIFFEILKILVKLRKGLKR